MMPMEKINKLRKLLHVPASLRISPTHTLVNNEDLKALLDIAAAYLESKGNTSA